MANSVTTARQSNQNPFTALIHNPVQTERLFRKVLRQGLMVWMVTSYVTGGTKGVKKLTLLGPLRWFLLFKVLSRALPKAKA
jgi:hypothetical protein